MGDFVGLCCSFLWWYQKSGGFFFVAVWLSIRCWLRVTPYLWCSCVFFCLQCVVCPSCFGLRYSYGSSPVCDGRGLNLCCCALRNLRYLNFVRFILHVCSTHFLRESWHFGSYFRLGCICLVLLSLVLAVGRLLSNWLKWYVCCRTEMQIWN